MFLIEIIDDELHKILEEQDWSILKEVFVEVSPWSENFKVSERSTWVAVSGIPFQCWNHTTFKRIAEVWGRLEAADENAALCKTGDKVNLLISTKQIEEIIEVEVGSILFEVRVTEMGLSDHNVQIARDRVNGNGVSKDGDESSSESFVESVRRSGPKNVAVDGCFDEVEGVNAILIGKDYNDYVGGTLNLGSSQFGDFVSGNGPSWVEVVTSNILEDPNLEARQLEVSTHLASALDNVRSMGLGPGDVTYLNEDVNVPISERLEDLVEMEQNENNLWKQTSIKHLRLRHWLLKNQRKIIRSG
ncbi:hypothetical protein V6N13_039038 [Hibiscus sabdariffa]